MAATGTLSALVTVEIGSQVSGRIASLHADFNSEVKEGDLIARIDPSLFEAAVQRARANLAVFTAKFDDKHEAFLQPGAALSTVLQNAAEAEINGLELEVLASPLNGLTLRGTLAWLDAKYKKFEEVQPNAGGLGIAEVVDRAGDTLEGTREWTYSLMSRYETPIGDIGTLGLQANWSWASKAEEDRFSTVLLAANRGQTELFEIFDRGNDSRGLLNMRVDFEIPDWGANIAFYCTNCTDKTIWQQGAGLASRQYISQLVGPPRMWGFQVTKRFGEFTIGIHRFARG